MTQNVILSPNISAVIVGGFAKSAWQFRVLLAICFLSSLRASISERGNPLELLAICYLLSLEMDLQNLCGNLIPTPLQVRIHIFPPPLLKGVRWRVLLSSLPRLANGKSWQSNFLVILKA